MSDPRPEDEALALAFANDLPFAGLRDHEHDPGVDRVVPPEAARAAHVVVLAADDQHVRLAAATPEPDLAALAGILGERRVEVAIAPRGELEAILGPPAPAFAEAPAPDEPSWLAPRHAPQRRMPVVIALALVVLAAGLLAAYLLTR
jgi:type II secretion system (T2SS) protein E